MMIVSGRVVNVKVQGQTVRCVTIGTFADLLNRSPRTLTL